MDENQKKIVKGMKVRELSSGRIATVTAVVDDNDQVWMVSDHMMGIFKKSIFWDHFEEVNHENN